MAAEFPEVTVAYQHVDAASMFFITDPGRYDVIVTDNLFGDIVTDIAAAVTGGIGLAASGNLDASGTNPSMFEPVHGSAPDIAGQGIADPTATVLSVGLLLEHLGRTDQAKKVNAAVAFDLSTRVPAGPGPDRRRRRPAGGPRQRLMRPRRRPHAAVAVLTARREDRGSSGPVEPERLEEPGLLLPAEHAVEPFEGAVGLRGTQRLLEIRAQVPVLGGAALAHEGEDHRAIGGLGRPEHPPPTVEIGAVS